MHIGVMITFNLFIELVGKINTVRKNLSFL